MHEGRKEVVWVYSDAGALVRLVPQMVRRAREAPDEEVALRRAPYHVHRVDRAAFEDTPAHHPNMAGLRLCPSISHAKRRLPRVSQMRG